MSHKNEAAVFTILKEFCDFYVISFPLRKKKPIYWKHLQSLQLKLLQKTKKVDIETLCNTFA